MSLLELFKTGFKSTIEFVRKERFFSFLIFLCAGGFYFFAKLASEILEGEGRAVDKAVLLWLRDPSNPHELLGPPWLHEMMRDLTALGGIGLLTIITVAGIIYLIICKKYGQSLYVGIAVGTGVILSNLLKIGFNRPRPDFISHESITYIPSFQINGWFDRPAAFDEPLGDDGNNQGQQQFVSQSGFAQPAQPANAGFKAAQPAPPPSQAATSVQPPQTDNSFQSAPSQPDSGNLNKPVF